MNFFRFALPVALAAGAIGFAPVPAQAQLQFDYGTNLTNQPLDGTPPWLSVLFEDFAPDVVHVTISGLFNPASSLNFASEIGFNVLNDAQSFLDDIVADATCAPLAGTTSCTTSNAGVLVGSTDGLSVNNWKGFDLVFLLPPPQGGAGNTVGTPPDSLKYSLTASGLTASVFAALSEPNKATDPTYYTVAKIQEVNNGNSSSISGEPGGFPPPPPPPPPVVESVPGPLGIAGVLGTFAWARKLRRRISAA